jgi:hypothetical protein
MQEVLRGGSQQMMKLTRLRGHPEAVTADAGQHSLEAVISLEALGRFHMTWETGQEVTAMRKMNLAHVECLAPQLIAGETVTGDALGPRSWAHIARQQAAEAQSHAVEARLKAEELRERSRELRAENRARRQRAPSSRAD